MDLDLLFGFGFGYIIIILLLFLIFFISFLGIGFKLRSIKKSLIIISNTFEEFNKKINKISIESRK